MVRVLINVFLFLGLERVAFGLVSYSIGAVSVWFG